MAKQFAMVVGWVLIVVGVLNFFVEPIMVMPVHALFHIVAGALGVWAAKEHSEGYTMWVGIVGLVLAILGFAGMANILGVIDLTVTFNYVHLILGVVGLVVYFMGRSKNGMMNSGV
ncbi:MAG: hypothetical protein AAB657_05260 [Patescibacteria group bacterium]